MKRNIGKITQLIVPVVGLMLIVLGVIHNKASQVISPVMELMRHDDWVYSVSWYSDQYLISSGGNLHIWDVDEWSLISHTLDEVYLSSDVADSGWIVAQTDTGLTRIIGLDGMSPVGSVQFQSVGTLWTDWDGDNLMIGSENQLEVWDQDSSSITFSSSVDGAWDIISGKLAIASESNEIQMFEDFDTPSGTLESTLSSNIKILRWHHNAHKILSVDDDGLVSLWDVASRTTDWSYPFFDDIQYAIWHPTMDVVLLVGIVLDDTIPNKSTQELIVLNIEGKLESRMTLDLQEDMIVGPITWNQEGRRIAIGASSEPYSDEWYGLVWIWDSQTGETVSKLEHPCPVTDLVWNPVRHNLLATGCTDGIVRIWDVSES